MLLYLKGSDCVVAGPVEISLFGFIWNQFTVIRWSHY